MPARASSSIAVVWFATTFIIAGAAGIATQTLAHQKVGTGLIAVGAVGAAVVATTLRLLLIRPRTQQLPSVSAGDAYEVRYGPGAVVPWALAALLPAAVIVVALRRWPVQNAALPVAVVMEVVLCAVVVLRIRRALRRDPALIINADGVLLGAVSNGLPAAATSWSQIDMLVHFTADDPASEAGPMQHIGIVRGRHLVASRSAHGWRLHLERAVAATAHFGNGTPFRQAPPQRRFPAQTAAAIRLPDDWLQEPGP